MDASPQLLALPAPTPSPAAAGEEWAAAVHRVDCEITPEIVITAEAAAQFRELADQTIPGSRRVMARIWLFQNGFIFDKPHQAPVSADAPASTDTPPSDLAANTPSPVLPNRPDLPAHPTVENGVLGCLVMRPDTIPQAVEALNPKDFSSIERSRLFLKLRDLSARGESITPVVIENEFHRTGMGSLVARDLVANVIRACAPADVLPRYISILKDYSARRAMLLASHELAEAASRGLSSRDGLAASAKILEGIGEQCEEELPPQFKLKRWPDPPAPEAFQGLAGEFVRLVGPRTEADPVAILGQLLVCFGNVINRKAHVSIDASKHYGNEFLCVVGLTARGRKGTSWDVTKLAFEEADPAWLDTCHHTGVASGEGLIRTVRDAVYSQLKVANEMHSCLEDAGVSDKRALWIEDEFQSVLSRMRCEGSTLSAWLRKAWQSGTMENANKNSPMRATNAHISMIGHITFKELSRALGENEIGNGFANRWIWLCSRRARLLPRGGDLRSDGFKKLLEPIAQRIQAAVEFANDELLEHIPFDCTAEAWAVWDATYPHLSRTRLGNVGEVTDRAEAHVRRLALIYALLDKSHKVTLTHLKAALAFWDYSERSVGFIFGDSDVDPVAEKLLAAITEAGDEGLSQNVITRKVFSGRKTEAVNKALEVLAQNFLIREIEKMTKGRKATVWVASR